MKREDLQKGWNAFVQWKGWKWIFPLPLWMSGPLFLLCGAGLVWVFVHGLEQWPPVYALYGLSAYTLTDICLKLPSGIQKGKRWLSRHPGVRRLFSNDNLKFRLSLYLSQMINFGYGILKIAYGVLYGTAWVGCDGIYNLAQAMIQLFQIVRRKKPGTPLHQWKSYRLCGVLILLMHLTLIGIVFQMINWNRAQEQGEIMVIVTATFAFYKFTTSFVAIAKDRYHTRPVDSSIRMLDLAQAIFSLFSLQASMFHTFGTGAGWEHMMNVCTGCAVCLLIVSIGLYMIGRGTREIKHLQETTHG